MFIEEASPIVVNTVFDNNSALFSGGGVYNWGHFSTTFINCAFIFNSAENPLDFGNGGGISNAGAGEFTAILKPDALTSSKVFWATVIHPPRLQITATIDPNMNVLVQLGLSVPSDEKNFRIPESIVREQSHILRINFSEWKITGAFLDDARPSIRRCGWW